MVAQSRGAKFHIITHRDNYERVTPASNKDDSLLNKALQDVADDFETTAVRYLEQLDFWGSKILDRNPRKDFE